MEKQISVFYPNSLGSNARCLSFKFTEIKDNPCTQSSSFARIHVQSVGCPDHCRDEGVAVTQSKPALQTEAARLTAIVWIISEMMDQLADFTFAFGLCWISPTLPGFANLVGWQVRRKINPKNTAILVQHDVRVVLLVSQREVVRGCEFVRVSGRNDFALTPGMCLWLSPGIFFVYARPKTRRLVGLVFT